MTKTNFQSKSLATLSVWVKENNDCQIEQHDEGLKFIFDNKSQHYQVASKIKFKFPNINHKLTFTVKCLNNGSFRLGLLDKERSQFKSIHEYYAQKDEIITEEILFKPTEENYYLVFLNNITDFCGGLILHDLVFKTQFKLDLLDIKNWIKVSNSARILIQDNCVQLLTDLERFTTQFGLRLPELNAGYNYKLSGTIIIPQDKSLKIGLGDFTTQTFDRVISFSNKKNSDFKFSFELTEDKKDYCLFFIHNHHCNYQINVKKMVMELIPKKVKNANQLNQLNVDKSEQVYI